MVKMRTPKMTLLLWIGLGAFVGASVGDLGVGTAYAGWEFNESARPKKKSSVYPKPAPARKKPETVEESTAVVPESRVQVFGKPASEMSADEYAEMVKEDAGEPAAAPVAPAVAAVAADEPEFEALRAKIRTRQVAENARETATDADPAAPSPKMTPRKAAKAATGRKATPYIPPPPPMETEVITPQKPTGKKVKGAKVESATESEATRSDEVNAAFPYTHLLPSPFNLQGGQYVIGTTAAYGILDFLQVSTNVARDLNSQWNFQAKVPLIEYPTFVASAFVDYMSFNPHSFDETNPDQRLKRWQPGLVTGYEITPDIAFFLGGNFNFGKEGGKIITTSGYLKGAQMNMEWSWLYNPSTSRLGNNAIALGLKYDFTYELFGFGLTHHWRNFAVGVHYTFADRARFLPIAGFTFSAGF